LNNLLLLNHWPYDNLHYNIINVHKTEKEKLMTLKFCYQESDLFSKKDGFPRKPFPNGWKGEGGLYAVGFTKRGLLGTSLDAKRIAEDISEQHCKAKATRLMTFTCAPPSQL
jgi:hypothetical protein